MFSFLEVVSSGECEKEFYSIEEEDSPLVGSVEAVWRHIEGTPLWVQVDGPSPGTYSVRHLILTATLRHMGVCLKQAVGDVFDHKTYSGDAWEYYLADGFMI